MGKRAKTTKASRLQNPPSLSEGKEHWPPLIKQLGTSLIAWYKDESKGSGINSDEFTQIALLALIQYASIVAHDLGKTEDQFLGMSAILYREVGKSMPRFGP